MDITFEKLFSDFKKLGTTDKSKAIIEFLTGNIYALQNLKKEIGNNLESKDINLITSENIDDHLDIIYQLLHVMTEQMEMFTEKVANDFFEKE